MSLKMLVIPGLLMILPLQLWGADLAREQRIAEQIEETILDGDPIYLKDGNHEFLAIYMRSDREPSLGAALVLHGKGANPDWTDVVQPLRTGLPEYGWDTLSIQLPVAHESANEREWLETVPEAAARIDAALAFLAERKVLNVVIVGHSFGARMAAAYLADNKPEQVTAFVAIGMSADAKKRQSGNLGALRRIQLPLYDLYGERDLPAVKNTARERRLAARDAENKKYRQNEIAGADHFFVGQEELLLANVRAWLFKEAGGSEVPLK